MLGRRIHAALLFLCSGAFAVSAAHAVSIVNGDFETGDTTGWTVTGSSSLNPFGTTYGSGFSGKYWAWLAGYEGPVSFDQVITGLTPGSSYAVDFIMASEFTLSDSLLVSIGGGSATKFTAPPYNTSGVSHNGYFWNTWVSKQFDFTATGTSEDLMFSTFGIYGGTTPQYDVGLDNVSISQIGGTVPEPSALALLGLGLVSLAVVRRRRLTG